jgi:hypothetical protein
VLKVLKPSPKSSASRRCKRQFVGPKILTRKLDRGPTAGLLTEAESGTEMLSLQGRWAVSAATLDLSHTGWWGQ